ncbi:ATP-binding protein [Kitasatospora sp. NPDC051170]|uniref:ATP-binding protein n=1 Tax=Kitasatospora sp. NPDC051170 TaxID=3364056 RepID=UPI003797E275
MILSPLANARFPVPLEWGEPPGPGAVPAARRLVVAILREWEVPLSASEFQELALCASEVIANALVHTGERCAVTVRRSAGRVRVEVSDSCPSLPRPERDPEGTSGRGLLLVEALAHAWGWHPAGPGKVVWFEFVTAPERPCPTHGWGTAGGLRGLGAGQAVGVFSGYQRSSTVLPSGSWT